MIDVCFDPAYARIFEETDGPCEVFEYENEFGAVRHLFLKREIPLRIDDRVLYDITTPYGYGGPLILHSTDKEKLMQGFADAFSDYCKAHNIVSEFVRFHLTDNVDVRERYYGQTRLAKKNIIVPTDCPYETVWMDYEHKVRKNVKKAQEYDLQAKFERNLDHIDDFLRIYYDTMKRNEASRYYYFSERFFEKLTQYIPESYVFCHILKDGKVISTELVLESERYAYSFLGGTDTEFYSMRPNDFLKDAVIRRCIETGKKGFILGGGYGDDDGIYRYKRSFTKSDDVPFYVGTAIFDQAAYDSLTALRRKQPEPLSADPNYFPMYRA